MMHQLIKVLIVDDHTIVREGLRTLLGEEADIVVVGEAANGRQALALAAELYPDVVLMDLVMPEMNGVEATRCLALVSKGPRVLVLTSFSQDHHVRDAIQAGALGYLLKDVLKADLLTAIRAAAQGIPTLHPDAQRQLMRQVSAPPRPSPVEGLTHAKSTC